MFWDCIRLIMGLLAKKPEVGKGMDLDDLGRNDCGKIEGRRDKQSWPCVHSGLSGRAPIGAIGACGWEVSAWGK